MSEQALQAARQALDFEFYGPPENQGPGSVYATLDARRSREDIAAVMVLTDLELCDRLIWIGLTASTGAALALVPVIAVAWADDAIQEPERLAILGGNDGYGFSHADCKPLLEHWLRVRPSPNMMAAWSGFVRALGGVMSPGDHDVLRDALVNLCGGVARAAGGMFRKVSSSEQKMLDHIHAVFNRG